MGSTHRISASRAFWELKADQVMDRVFPSALPAIHPAGQPGDGDHSPIDVIVREEPPRRPAAAAGAAWWAGAATAVPPRLGGRPLLVLLALFSLVGMGSTLLVWRGWNQASLALQQERTLQLLERLRSLAPLGSVDPEPATVATVTANGTSASAGDGLPPPPPEEAWIEELEPLSSATQAAAAPPLRVPLSGTITRRAPAAPAIGSWVGDSAGPSSGRAAPSGGGTPELVGVVQVPGQSGSAIFQMGGSSTSASVGEPIGNSGWRLHSASGDSVVIERDGRQQRVSISGGF